MYIEQQSGSCALLVSNSRFSHNSSGSMFKGFSLSFDTALIWEGKYLYMKEVLN